ncbi:LTA synthase family protein [Sphingobacterium sp. 1.A.4]|uniref:LTA synthase family protein n=1 Tax=Sphingobacterium sp. 1.A.4 TaxID=2044603 RepID=UPI000C0BC944|nr:alkaline phosphatase family protein [Sphingobacterium sp. 1.A.4]
MQRLVHEFNILLRYFAFWLIICFIDRAVFIASFSEKIGEGGFMDVLEIYWHGLSLDFSVAAYICAIPFLLYFLSYFIPKMRWGLKPLHVYTMLVLILFFLTMFINVNIYREWGDKISKRAVDAVLEDAMGALASAESTPIFIPIMGVILGVGLSYWLYTTLFKNLRYRNFHKPTAVVLLFVLIAGLLFTFIRGGYGRAPLNPSRAYFSSEAFYNHAAVNTQYALLKEYFSSNRRNHSPYLYFEPEERKEILKPVFTQDQDSSLQILTNTRPNIVLLVLESFTADLVESLGGEKGVSPKLEKIMQQGVSFQHIYATSDRSDKGIIGIFSAFPGQGPESIIKYIDKHENLPGMGQELDSLGYRSAFYHGGQSEFYNMKSFMLAHGVEEVIDNHNFNPLEERSSWGVYDHVVFKRMLKDIQKEKQPFFYSLFTLNNHEPFTLNNGYKFGDKSNADKFRSTAYYTDSVIMDFLEQAKKTAWYKNTLFVLVADHGHRLPSEKFDISHPNRFHIPMVFFGEVIKPAFRGLKVDKIGNQNDLVATLFKQLGIPADRYRWSRDLLDPQTPSIAFYNSKNSFGIIQQDQEISYDHVGNSINYMKNKDYPKAKTDSLLNIAKAYYQEVYQDFMNY